MAGEPLELIRYDAASGKFVVGAAALAVLRELRAPLAVVAVAGRARQGKSFLLNQLLQVTGGFKIGSTTRPCTKGLWMWSAPQRRVDAQGREFYVVLLDTEGIDAYDQTAQYSTQIFSLAVLLSSLFVYNQMGGIDEAALDRLSLVTEMTKHIRVRAGGSSNQQQQQQLDGGGGEDDARELRQLTPSFLWLLRDFYLRLEDEEGRKVTASDYLETALMPVAGSGGAVEAKNAVRASIKALFPDRDCATLVRPVHEEQALLRLDELEPAQLRPEFRAGVAALVSTIFAKAQPKRLGCLTLVGPVLAGLAQAYVGAINDGAVPAITTAWQGVAEQECRRAADVAEAAYAGAFAETVVPEEAALEGEHHRCMAVAEAAFRDVAVGDDVIQAAHKQRFRDACCSRFSQLRGRKLAEAAATVSELLLQASSDAAAALRAPDASPEKLQAMLAQFLDAYAARASGPLKWPKLLEFLKSTYPQLLHDAMARQAAQVRADVARLAEELALAHRQLGSVHDRAAQAEAELGASRAEAVQLQGQLLQQAQELAAHRVAGENRAAQVAALEVQLREVQLVAEKKLLSLQQEAEAAARQARLAAQQDVTELQSCLAAEQRRTAELSTEVCELEGRLAGLAAQLAAKQGEAADAAVKAASAKGEAAALARQLDEARAQLAAAALHRQLAERQRDDALSAVTELQAQLECIGEEIQLHVSEAEAERHRSEVAASDKAPMVAAGSYHVESESAELIRAVH